MSEFVYNDYTPANARVIVDYRKGQKVSFSYPREWTYWRAVWKQVYPLIQGVWHLINYYPLLLFGFLFVLYIAIKAIFFPSIVVTESSTILMNYSYVLTTFFYILLVIFYFFGIPAVVTFIFALDKNRLSLWFPKLGAFVARTRGSKQKDFSCVDVHDKMCCIPCFDNMFLEYEPSGDFEKYLERVEILEYPFVYHDISLFRKKKKTNNDVLFRAVFYFSETPQCGGMEVKFS